MKKIGYMYTINYNDNNDHELYKLILINTNNIDQPSIERIIGVINKINIKNCKKIINIKLSGRIIYGKWDNLPPWEFLKREKIYL